VKHKIQHTLGQEKASTVAKKALASYQERFSKYSPQANWKSEHDADITFSVKGLTLQGAVEIGASEILLELEVPFMLRPFKGKALGIIEEEIRKWIVKAEAGEL